MPAPLIEARGLGFKVRAGAGEINIQRGLDLRVNAGEAVGIVGPSGSGKTSLLMLLAGLERPTSGTLLIDGADIGAMDEDALARFRRERLGIVFQAFHLIPTMTAATPTGILRSIDRFDLIAVQQAVTPFLRAIGSVMPTTPPLEAL